jgi:hypothetical protein
LKPTSDSDIKIEVWLPAASAEGSGEPRRSSEERRRASGWNGKFQAVGNGGWAGSISYPALLMYHGWADPQIAALNSVDYFNSVTREVGKSAVGKSIQLYMVPGMAHCQGGPGTDTFDKMAAIEQWVDERHSPGAIVASHATGGKVNRTRPLCPYGKVAKWNGSGSTDDAANFACVDIF